MNIDYTISSFFAQNHVGGGFDYIMMFFSSIANSGFIYIFVGLILLTFKKTRKLGIGIALCLIVMFLINDMALKNIIGRPRPYVTYPDLAPYVLGVVPGSKSCPSGHTTIAFTIATYFACYKKKYLKPTICLYIFATIVGFSRIYLIHHYFSDVMIGILVGIILGICTYFLHKFLCQIYTKKLLKN